MTNENRPTRAVGGPALTVERYIAFDCLHLDGPRSACPAAP
jgi:hypothetical protein